MADDSAVGLFLIVIAVGALWGIGIGVKAGYEALKGLGLKSALIGWVAGTAGLALALALVYFVAVPQYQSYGGRPNDVERILQRLTRGSAVVTAPKSVKQYESFNVSLAVAGEKLESLLATETVKARPDSQLTGLTDVLLSPRMKAELIGPDFEIAEQGAQEQAVSARGTTVWVWTVRSGWPGTRKLKVRLHALVSVRGVDTPRSFQVAEHELAVQIDPFEWAVRNWQWVASALLLPFIGWGAARLLGGNKPGAP